MQPRFKGVSKSNWLVLKEEFLFLFNKETNLHDDLDFLLRLIDPEKNPLLFMVAL